MFIGYFNDVSYELIKWSFEELKLGNKVKATKIERLADKLENNHRKKNNIPLKEDIWCYRPYINEWKHAYITRCIYDKIFSQ